MITTEITFNGETWSATITNGKHNLKVIIDGMESKEIAKCQAKDRIKELKRAGLI
jgi:hypothetical protein